MGGPGSSSSPGAGAIGASPSSGGPTFFGLPVQPRPGSGGQSFEITGSGYNAYRADQDIHGGREFVRNPGGGSIQTISPDQVEGVEISASDLDNPSKFWGMHGNDGTPDFFMETASHIPEVQARLDDGASLDEIKTDPALGKCASVFFDSQNAPRVVQGDGYYEFDGDGRHRIIAARALGYDIPMRVVGRYVSK